MPRAYRPRLTTTTRAYVAATALGARSWHLFHTGTWASKQPFVTLFWDDSGKHDSLSLAEAERLAFEKNPSAYVYCESCSEVVSLQIADSHFNSKRHRRNALKETA